MKKIATAVFLILFIFAAEVAYINYRLEHKLDTLELSQQNILTKVYSLERNTVQIKQSVQQALKKHKLNPIDKHNFLFTNSELLIKKYGQQKMEGIN